MPYYDVPGDLQLSSDRKSLVWATDGACSEQRLTTGSLTGRGSWEFDRRKGFPYLEILDKASTPEYQRLLVVQWLLSFDFVTEVREVKIVRDASVRSMQIFWTVDTDSKAVVSNTLTLVS